MSEIEKMYENAEVKKQIPKVCSSNELYCKECEAHIENAMPYCRNAEYPTLTAEKQLELIKYFSNNYNISINKDNNIFRLLFLDKDRIHNFYANGVDFAEPLALFVISRFQNKILTEQEKQQIKEILE